MNILMIHPHDIFSPLEPWTRRIRAIAKEFAGRGHRVKLVYFSMSVTDGVASLQDGYEAIPYKRKVSPAAFFSSVHDLTVLAEWADVVHFQKCHHYASIPALIAAWRAKKPLHYDWDDWEEMIWFESCGKRPVSRLIGFSYHLLERFLPILSDTVSVASSRLRELAIKRGAKEDDIYSAPVGADLDVFVPGLDGSAVRRKYFITGPLILYLGQLHGSQHLDLFIDAAAIVLSKRPEAVFMIAGTGSMIVPLKEQVKRLNIQDKVVFTGAVPPDDVPAHIASADVCVGVFRDTKVTSCKSPLKIVEYMAMAKGIVANRVGEVTHMLDGAGVLVGSEDASSLAQGIISLIDDKPLCRLLGRRARQNAEKTYNWAVTAQSILRAYGKSV
jgi:glycosyltransferase involved in cell wall biosynthesis